MLGLENPVYYTNLLKRNVSSVSTVRVLHCFVPQMKAVPAGIYILCTEVPIIVLFV